MQLNYTGKTFDISRDRLCNKNEDMNS